MPLFVAHHAHSPETCPASREGAAGLIAHVSAANAARYGVSIQAEALLDGHHLVLIVEAAAREQVETFMGFFAPLGEVQVLSASSAEDAVRRGGCSANLPVSREPGGGAEADRDEDRPALHERRRRLSRSFVQVCPWPATGTRRRVVATPREKEKSR